MVSCFFITGIFFYFFVFLFYSGLNYFTKVFLVYEFDFNSPFLTCSSFLSFLMSIENHFVLSFSKQEAL
jgi:hypothetical protein